MSQASVISSNLLLTPDLFSSTITLYVPANAPSATITTAPGSTFLDGTTSKTITGYITVCSNAQNSTVWTIQDIFPYSNDYADLTSLQVDTFGIRSTLYYPRHFTNAGYISSLGTLQTPSLTKNGSPVAVIPNLTSTVDGLGSVGYISYGFSFVPSTIAGLGNFYISSPPLQSTITGLGRTYISVDSLPSTIAGYSNSIQEAQLVSTVNGIGCNYIPVGSLQSTVQGLSNTYIMSSTTVSTVTSFLAKEQESIVSTVTNLGHSYLSSTALQSTVLGLGSFYVSSAQLNSLVGDFSVQVNAQLLATMVANLASEPGRYISSTQMVSTVNSLLLNLSSTVENLGYVSSTQLFSTVGGLGITYISSASLQSTVLGLYATNDASMQSTVAGLGNTYVSVDSLTSTVAGSSNTFANQLISFYTNLGSIYISSASLTSTVEGLGTTYVSTASLVSTINGYCNLEDRLLHNLITDSGSIYISTESATSTSSGLTTSFSNAFLSTVAGLGSRYVSSTHLASTVAGMGTTYISTASLQSTFTSIRTSAGNLSIIEIENSLGTFGYISTSALVSSTIGVQPRIDSLQLQELQTTIADLSIYGYYSYTNLQSTVAGLGSIYLVGSNLTSTTSGLLALNYISTSTAIPSTITEAIYTSTTAGLGGLALNGNSGASYVSTTSLVSTVSNLYVRQLISTTGGFSALGFSNIPQLFSNGYVYSSGGTNLSTTSNFYEQSNTVMASLPIVSFGSNSATTFKTIGFGSNYIFGDGTYLTISSDRNYKEDIVPLSSAVALEQVLSLNGTYYRKCGDTQSYIGCIAQDVEKVFPEVITTHSSLEPSDLKSIKYEFLLAPLVESVKELISMHSTLKYFAQKKDR